MTAQRMAAIALAAALVSGCGASSLEAPEQSGLTVNVATSTPIATGEIKKVAEQFVSPATPGTSGYKIGPQDVLEISVFKVAELGRTIQVADNGTVNVPLLGDVPAAGLTPRELEVSLAKRWGDRYLRDPQVSVFVKEHNSQRVTVDGAVKRPGVFPLKGELTLMQAIAQASGLEEIADSEVLIFREADGKRQAARFNLNEIRSGAAKDPLLASNDVVVVGSSAAKEMLNNFAKIVPIARLFTVF